jgi:predicted Zn-dependent protease
VPDDRIERFRRVLASHPENSLARFSLSQAYFDASQYAEAIPELRQVIAGKPDWMLAHILLGRALIETGKPAEARPVLERGLELARLQGHAGPMAEVAEILASLRS